MSNANTPNYVEQGGARTVIGGLLDVVAGGVLNVDGLVSGVLRGFQFPAVARTATADGTGTGTIAEALPIQRVTVTAADANHIIVLPAPTPGAIVILRNGATGYELRSSAPATVSINGGAEANAESAIGANAMVIAVCTTATAWQAISLSGTTLAAVQAAAA